MKKKEIKEVLEKLLSWTPEGVDLKSISRINYPPKHFPKKEYGEICSEEDAECPFFSEAYLYNLLGKEDARTLLALMRNFIRSLGMDDVADEI